MPLYEYECTACHRRTEKIQKFSDPELTVCPHCGGPLERTITAPSVQFKGGGWYKDLYSSAKPAAASGDSGAAAASSGEGASNDKPASGSDSAGSGGDTKPASTAPATPAPAAAPAASAPAKSTSGA